jgi:acetate kinase
LHHPVRDRVVQAAAWLGGFAVHVIPTNEELMIATHTRRVLGL